ncbi:MAG: alpha/beta hydrolase-fold protein [Bacteroidota bacterium]
MKSTLIVVAIALTLLNNVYGQVDTCTFRFHKYQIESKFLNQQRDFWVSLPLHYSDTVEYSVMYVFDAEWRFDLIRNVEFDYSANNKIDKHIIVGIPHIDWEKQRGIDLSFSQSRMEYDGEAVDSTWYNGSNSGGGMKFYQYLTKELMPTVDSLYSTNANNTLIGHSMGGYFAGYILSMDHPFSTLHLYDPSIWYSDGEVTERISTGIPKNEKVNVLITYQPVPTFHKQKIEELINELKNKRNVSLHYHLYEDETHNSLFLPSFLRAIELEKERKGTSSK